jgi:hypothetical protein
LNATAKQGPARVIRMTGPYRARRTANRKPFPFWLVAIVGGCDRQPGGTSYKCLSYGRAIRLACAMARDRRLFLHVDALPV